MRLRVSYSAEETPLYGKNALICLIMLLCSLGGCQGTGDAQRSPWLVAESIFESALSPEINERRIDSRYVGDEAVEQLRLLSSIGEGLEPLGLLSISEGFHGQWTGYYAYLVGGWPSLFEFTLHRRQGLPNLPWELHALPFLSAYLKLTELVTQPGNDQVSSERSLPWVRRGSEWHGGLSGRDNRGRPLSSVVVVWVPPLAFVDGLPLDGVANRQTLSEQLSSSFSERQRLAHQSQATYTRHVSLALPAGAPAAQVVDLMAWCEGAGAEQVSLLARSRKGPAMIYLNGRVSRLHVTSPQRLLHAQLSNTQSQLTIQRTDQEQREQTRDVVSWESSLGDDRSFSRQSSNTYLSLLERARQRAELDGLSIHIEPSTTVASLLYFIDLARQIDDDLPLTIAPHSAEATAPSLEVDADE